MEKVLRGLSFRSCLVPSWLVADEAFKARPERGIPFMVFPIHYRVKKAKGIGKKGKRSPQREGFPFLWSIVLIKGTKESASRILSMD